MIPLINKPDLLILDEPTNHLDLEMIEWLDTYKGNYSYYLEKKEERVTREAIEVGKAKQLYKKELMWMRKQPKARTTKSKSRIDDFTEIKHRAHQRRKEKRRACWYYWQKWYW